MTERAARLEPRTLILHIGDHKTGTTTIQHALAQNRVRVRGERPFYGADLNHNDIPGQAMAVLKQTSDAQAAHAALTSLAARMSTSDARVYVLSAEEFEDFAPHMLRAVLDQYFGTLFDEIKIIAYVRPHIQRLISNYTEDTKIGYFDGDLEAYAQQCISQDRLLYTKRFVSWSQEFGDDFTLRPAIRSEMDGGSIVNDMFRSTLGPVDITIDPLASQNESLCLEDLLRVKFLHAQLKGRRKLFHHRYGWTLQRLLEALPKSTDSTRINIHRSLASRMGTFYQRDAVDMDTTFFQAKPLLQDALKEGVQGACQDPQMSDAVVAFSSSEIRSLTLSAKMISVLLENAETPWPKFLHSQRIDSIHRK